jgi:hypothetical protein
MTLITIDLVQTVLRGILTGIDFHQIVFPLCCRPIWVIARLKIKLERARHAIMARHELVRPKHAIKPEGGFKILWDLITTLLLVYTLFEIPLEIAFIEAGKSMAFGMHNATLKGWLTPESCFDPQGAS